MIERRTCPSGGMLGCSCITNEFRPWIIIREREGTLASSDDTKMEWIQSLAECVMSVKCDEVYVPDCIRLFPCGEVHISTRLQETKPEIAEQIVSAAAAFNHLCIEFVNED